MCLTFFELHFVFLKKAFMDRVCHHHSLPPISSFLWYVYIVKARVSIAYISKYVNGGEEGGTVFRDT